MFWKKTASLNCDTFKKNEMKNSDNTVRMPYE